MIRIPGATTTYTLNEDGRVTVRQGNDDTEYVRKVNGQQLRSVQNIGTYADGGVWCLRFHTYYEIGRDDIARSIAAEEHQRRAAAVSPPRFSGPLSDWG
jgi:hypothetical protein